MEQLVLEELHRIRKEGFTQSAIDAAINTTEFSLRENNTGRFPRGLSMMLRAMNAWVYDRDPYKCAALSSTWARIPLAGHPTPVMHAIHALTAPPPPGRYGGCANRFSCPQSAQLVVQPEPRPTWENDERMFSTTVARRSWLLTGSSVYRRRSPALV